MTKWQLFSALAQLGNTPTVITATDGRQLATGLVQSVERESGNGRSFNIRIVDSITADSRNIYIVTQD